MSIYEKINAAETRKAIIHQNEGCLSFGIRFLDDAFVSIQKTDLITLSSYSGVGKSTLATNIAMLNAAKGVRVFYFALEAGPKEVSIRISYKLAAEKYFRDLNRKNIDIKYLFYKRDCIDRTFMKYALAAEKDAENLYKNLTIIYRDSAAYTVKDFLEEFLILDVEADLIIIDHINYFDADGRTTEYSLLSEAMKAIRDKVLLHQIPCIVVTHLNRPDRKIKRIVPDLDDLHGSSNIGKISTGSFFISRDPDASINGDLPTLIRIAKNRDNGSSVNYVAQMLFDESLNSYKEDYMLFRLKNFDTEMEEIKKENMPCWAKGAANGREIPTTTKVTSKCQMDLGYK